MQQWWHPHRGFFSFALSDRVEPGVVFLPLWSIHFKICLFQGALPHITVVLSCYLDFRGPSVSLNKSRRSTVWPLRATRLFCPQTCHRLEALFFFPFVCLFVCSYFFSLVAPFWLNWSHRSEWTSQNSGCVYIGISTSGIKHHTAFRVAQITSCPFYHLVKRVTESLNPVCMLYTHVLFMYSVTHCLEEKAVCVNEKCVFNRVDRRCTVDTSAKTTVVKNLVTSSFKYYRGP